MEKTHVSKAVSDEKSPLFPEKSRGNFGRFPYETSDEKVSHIFPENFSKSFLSEIFPKCLESFEQFPDRTFWKKFPPIFWKNFSVGMLIKTFIVHLY